MMEIKGGCSSASFLSYLFFFFFFLLQYNLIYNMAQQAKQAAQRLGGMFPKGSGKGLGSAVGAITVLGALGYGVNASLFNGK